MRVFGPREGRGPFPGAAVAPAFARDPPSSAGREPQVSHAAGAQPAPRAQGSAGGIPRTRGGRGAAADREGGARTGRGGARTWRGGAGAPPASERVGPGPAPATPTCRAEPSVARFVRFVCAHLSRLPGRKVAIPDSAPGAAPGKGCWLGRAVVGETRAVWRGPGDPFPGARGRGCSFE